jgi:tripartite-type tricarboxylate transporter receptor subunit TctC
MHRTLRGAVAAVAALAAALSAHAQPQSWPSKPIHLVVPYAAGGGTDISARVIAQHLAESLGQPVIVENKPGAGTVVGSAYVAKSAPDGYTFVYGSVTHTIAPALYKEKMPFDAVKDFTPVTEVAIFPFLFLTRSTSPITTIQGLIAEAKAHPGKLNYASVGNGTGTNLSGEMFKLLSGTQIVHVPYNGSGPAITALLGSQVDIAISDPPPAIAHIRNGSIRPLAVTTAKRSSAFPDVPTLAEAGVPGFEFTSWWGIFGPANLPPAVTERMAKEVAKALQAPDVKAKLAAFSAEPVGNTPAEFAATVKSEVAKFAKVVNDSHISVE